MSASLIFLTVLFFVLLLLIFGYLVVKPAIKKRNYRKLVPLFIVVIIAIILCYLCSVFLGINSMSAMVMIFSVIMASTLIIFIFAEPNEE